MRALALLLLVLSACVTTKPATPANQPQPWTCGWGRLANAGNAPDHWFDGCNYCAGGSCTTRVCTPGEVVKARVQYRIIPADGTLIRIDGAPSVPPAVFVTDSITLR